jgi:hypothetical protein
MKMGGLAVPTLKYQTMIYEFVNLTKTSADYAFGMKAVPPVTITRNKM